MATVLRKMIEDTSFRAELMSGLAFDTRSLTPSQYPIKKRQDIGTPPAQPTRVLVRQVDLAPEGSPYPIAFIEPDRSHSIQDFNAVLAAVVDRSYVSNGAVVPYFRPLDLKLKTPTRYIIKLSDRWSWRFNSKANAVTLGEFINMPEQDKYCDLWHVLDDGRQSPAPFTDELCRIAYFDADPVSTNFHHPYNLNVELVFADVGGQSNTLPIVIDPDIRYPGGSGEP